MQKRSNAPLGLQVRDVVLPSLTLSDVATSHPSVLFVLVAPVLLIRAVIP